MFTVNLSLLFIDWLKIAKRSVGFQFFDLQITNRTNWGAACGLVIWMTRRQEPQPKHRSLQYLLFQRFNAKICLVHVKKFGKVLSQQDTIIWEDHHVCRQYHLRRYMLEKYMTEDKLSKTDTLQKLNITQNKQTTQNTAKKTSLV